MNSEICHVKVYFMKKKKREKCGHKSCVLHGNLLLNSIVHQLMQVIVGTSFDIFDDLYSLESFNHKSILPNPFFLPQNEERHSLLDAEITEIFLKFRGWVQLPVDITNRFLPYIEMLLVEAV